MRNPLILICFFIGSVICNAQVNPIEEGAELFRQHKLKEALAKFEIAIKLWPDSARAFLGRGVMKDQLGDSNGALP
ncbi:MAG TPA: hypothetical protein VNZ45_06830, partial [Bacteroidia bacterium]|nr:hypothetical protein [Bacteroidia bacterium]